MKRDNVNYLLVGTFVLVMGAVLLYALYRISGHRAPGVGYHAHFVNIAGIKDGSLVTYQGYEIGNVAGIEPTQRDGRTVYRVGLNLRQAQRIPADSQALIASPGLLSAPLIDIREGRSLETIPAGGEIPAGHTANLMESVAALADDFARLSATSIKPLLAQIQRDAGPALGDLRSTLDRLNRAAGRVDALFSEDNVRHLNALLRNADAASGNALRLTADLADVRAEVDALIKDSRALVSEGGQDVREALRRVDATLYQLEAAGRHLNEFARGIRDNPAALISSRPPQDSAPGAATSPARATPSKGTTP